MQNAPQNYQYSPPEDGQDSGESFDLKGFAYTLIEKSWLIILCAAAAAFLTFGYLKRSPKIFASTAVLQVESERAKILPGADSGGGDSASPEALKTIEKQLQTRALFERVIQTNRLTQDARFIDPEAAREASTEQLVGRLWQLVKVGQVLGTRLINVTVEHEDPKLVELLVNSIVGEFMIMNYQQHYSGSEGEVAVLLGEVEKQKKKWQDAEAALQRYREQIGSAALDTDLDIVGKKLLEISQKLTEAENERLGLQSEMQQVQKAGANVSMLLGLRSVSSDASVADLKNKLGAAIVQFGVITNDYKEKHPKYIKAVNEQAKLDSELSNSVIKATTTLRNSYMAATNTETQLRQSLEAQNKLVLAIKEQRIRYKELEGAAQADHELFNTLGKLLGEKKIGKEFEQSHVRVIQRGYLPEKPIRPDKQRILLMGLLAGPLLGLALAFGLEALDSSLKTPDQTENFLKQPILAAIPKIRSVERGKHQLIMAVDPSSVGAEAFRTLRTALSMLGTEETRRTFLFTSAIPEEGKTFCALNYACSLAQQGLKTLLIESDLRCPTVESCLGLPQGALPGVADYLVKHTKITELVHATEVPKFFIMPAGTRAPNPAELLSQARFGEMIQEALQHFDRVVVDSAPIQPVSDSLLIVKRVQTVCLVMRAGGTPRRSVLRAVQMLQKAGAPLAGVVVNRLAQMRGETYYDYSNYPQYTSAAARETAAVSAKS